MQYDKTEEKKTAVKLRAMAHPTRSWIIKTLAKEDHRVGEFVKATGVEFATMSRHLAKLRSVGLISGHKKGREIYYRLNISALEAIFSELKGS